MISNLNSTKGSQRELSFSNLKVGLIFVKSKVPTDQGVCLSRISENDVHDKWIVVAGNSYSVNVEVRSKTILFIIWIVSVAVGEVG